MLFIPKRRRLQSASPKINPLKSRRSQKINSARDIPLVRSRSQPERELRNPLLWSAIWQRALDHIARPGSPVRWWTKLAEARAITAEWRRRFPDEAAWLRLVPGGRTGVRAAMRCGVRQLERALRYGGRGSQV